MTNFAWFLKLPWKRNFDWDKMCNYPRKGWYRVLLDSTSWLRKAVLATKKCLSTLKGRTIFVWYFQLTRVLATIKHLTTLKTDGKSRYFIQYVELTRNALLATINCLLTTLKAWFTCKRPENEHFRRHLNLIYKGSFGYYNMSALKGLISIKTEEYGNSLVLTFPGLTQKLTQVVLL